MTKLTDTFELNNGTKIPKVGFGTWQIPAGKARQAVLDALSVGYRHVDTALVYGNEKQVGQGIRDSGIPRDQLFVTSKLPAESKSYEEALRDFETTFNNLNIEHLDLYLIHAPEPWRENGANYDAENQDVWRAMEEIYHSGRVKAIGVSNFRVHDLQNILEVASVKPAIDQIQYYVGYNQPKVSAFGKQENILIEAYSPLATGGLLGNPVLTKMAANYHVTLPQLAIQFVIQNGVLPLPKATSKEHIESNGQLDFEISAADMVQLNAIQDTDARYHFM